MTKFVKWPAMSMMFSILCSTTIATPHDAEQRNAVSAPAKYVTVYTDDGQKEVLVLREEKITRPGGLVIKQNLENGIRSEFIPGNGAGRSSFWLDLDAHFMRSKQKDKHGRLEMVVYLFDDKKENVEEVTNLAKEIASTDVDFDKKSKAIYFHFYPLQALDEKKLHALFMNKNVSDLQPMAPLSFPWK